MDMELVHPNNLAVEIFVAALWFFPIGAVVMRRHFGEATGTRLVARNLLYTFAAVTAPFALLITGVLFLASARETLETLLMLFRAAS